MFLKNVLAYLSSSLAGQILLGLQQFIIRYLIPPSLLAVWNYVGVIQGLTNTFDLGLDAALSREIPLISAENDVRKEQDIRSVAFWGKLIQLVMLSIGVFLYFLWNYKHIEPALRISFVVAIFVIITSGVIQTFISFFQSHYLYAILSKIQLSFSVLSFVFLPISAYFFNINGFLVTTVILQFSLVIMYIILLRKHLLFFTSRPKKDLGKALLKVGIPLRLVNYPQGLLMAIDGILITSWLGLTPLVIYVTSKNIFKLLSEIPTRIGTVFITRCFKIHSTHKNYVQIGQELYIFLILNYTLLTPLICLGAYIVFSYILITFVPQYKDAVTLFSPLFLGLFFMPQTSILQNLLYIEKRMIHIGVSNLIMLAGFLASAIFFKYSNTLSLHHIAISLTISFFAYHCFILVSFGKTILGEKKALFILLLSIAGASLTYWSLSRISTETLFIKGNPILGLVSATIVAIPPILIILPIGITVAYKFHKKRQHLLSATK